MFFFKREKIHLDCFTSIGAIAREAPIEKTASFIPEWWKKLPPGIEEKATFGIGKKLNTMKTCYGFIELYKQGVVIPLWSDLKIKVVSSTFYYSFAMERGHIDSHHPNQHGNHFKNSINIKITNPWLLKEKTGVKFLFSECFWNVHEKFPNFRMLPGIADFKHQYSAHINCFASVKEEPYEYLFELGMPLVQLIPLSDKSIEPHMHVVDHQEYLKLEDEKIRNRFTKFLPRRIKKIKEIEKRVR